MTSNMQLRSYQTDIVNKALEGGNTIAMLPTGSGKTLIAAELMRQVGPPSLFLVPTILLVEQQAEALRGWTGLRIGEYFGGAPLPVTFDILVSTPKAFQMAQARGVPSLQWNSFHLVVFDEVHHVLKDHPYRKLALSLRQSISQGMPEPLILGLTASLTYAVGQKQVEAAVGHITDELRIKVMATATEEEMRQAGYMGTRAQAEVCEVDVPHVVASGVVPPGERKPHLMHQMFFGRVRAGTATRVSIDLHEIIVAMEVAVQTVTPQFKSPLKQASLKSWGELAHKLASSTRGPMFKSLEHWYEALRALVVSWEEGDDAAVTFLRMCGEDSGELHKIWPETVQRKLLCFWTSAPSSFLRFDNLKDVVLYKYEEFVNSGKEFRGLLFVQQRLTTHILEYLIRSDAELAACFRPACIYATSSPATPTLAVSASESKRRLAAFASGEVNLLITTSVCEEGMDVPMANCVLSFDPMISSVSLVQRRGRARQADSAFVVLSERKDRTAAHLAEVEKQQIAIVQNFRPGERVVDSAKENTGQKSRELGARSVLDSFKGDSSSALAALNQYCKKTKVDASEGYTQSGDRCKCTLGYTSVLRSVSAEATADVQGSGKDAKKDAKKKAAAQLLKALQGQGGI